ncbi:branched-chain amino acid ABC transporter permease [Christensenellaceae bacterium NSJ-63]|uniref:Branched-chain amino acid ABC transporter permease n=1 Tax=Guopingia tenuis TaxID=2763656 RepID=A0A926HX97_9FIRM|nr:branched-chain amino acid ABC transporter permease [Guopingia tenuis]MBC8538536.1 branched-chain amino acid ABC transporter permease [Guopingia tenuis]MBS5645369.1 branched-chain amino acid ABC transporter permease [Clostridiales bacterium]
MNVLSQIINGLHIGSIYALVALGYSMVYGIIKLINFAHGEIIMVGAYAVYVMLVLVGTPLWIAVLVSLLFCACMGMLIERVAYRRLRNKNAPRISLLITAIGVSIFLQNLAQTIFSSSGKSFPNVMPQGSIRLGDAEISALTLITLATAAVLMIGLQLLVSKTKMGKAMRAVSEDAGAAKLMGINTNVTITWTFAIGSALASIAALLYSSAYPLVTPYMGSTLGLKAFIAAVLGGIGSVPGAMLGGFLLGIAETLAKGYISSVVADAIVFGILILVLLIRPAGLLGRNVKEKV